MDTKVYQGTTSNVVMTIRHGKIYVGENLTPFYLKYTCKDGIIYKGEDIKWTVKDDKIYNRYAERPDYRYKIEKECSTLIYHPNEILRRNLITLINNRFYEGDRPFYKVVATIKRVLSELEFIAVGMVVDACYWHGFKGLFNIEIKDTTKGRGFDLY